MNRHQHRRPPFKLSHRTFAGLAAMACAVMAAPSAEARIFGAPHLKTPHLRLPESKPKVVRVDQVTLAITADEPGADGRAIRAAARMTLAEGYDRFEVVSDPTSTPISFVGVSRRTLTIFVRMSHGEPPQGGPPNVYDARALMAPAKP